MKLLSLKFKVVPLVCLFGTIYLVCFKLGVSWTGQIIKTSGELKSDEVVYMVLTSEKTIASNGLAIWRTWAKDCSQIVFACNCNNVLRFRQLKASQQPIPDELQKFSEVADLPILNLNITESYDKMGRKVLLVLEFVYDKFSKKSWYFMTDDDTFVYPHNLNKFIAKINPAEPLVYGFKYNHNAKPVGYVGGGSGILFTNESINRLVEKIKTRECDRFIDTYGDVTIGECGKYAGLSVGNSSDEHGKPRFNYAPPDVHYNGPVPFYLYVYGVHNKKIGRDCCSAESISFHQIKPQQMYSMYANKTLLHDLFS